MCSVPKSSLFSSSYAVAGGEHTLHSNGGDGRLSSAGACGLGWCRSADLAPSLFGFRPVVLGEPAALVRASYYHNLVVGERSGRLYSWGCGTFVEGGSDGVIPALGRRGASARDVGDPPTAVPLGLGDDERIKDVAAGAYHSAVLTSAGRVLTFGANQLGQLGRPVAKDASTDSSGLPVDSIPSEAFVKRRTCENDQDSLSSSSSSSSLRIAKIGAGFYNTFAVCRDEGRLYCAGENQNRQCGAGPKNLRSLAPVAEVKDRGVVVAEVEGGYCHTLVRTVAGEVLSLGCGDDGQRGDGRRRADDDDDDDDEQPAITSVRLPEGVRASGIAAGANHSVVLGTDGRAYAFGANDVGQCGIVSSNDDDDDDEGAPVWTPARVRLPPAQGEEEKVVRVSAGYAHTVLTTESGEIYVFGQNDNGQLGLGSIAYEEKGCERKPVKVGTID